MIAQVLLVSSAQVKEKCLMTNISTAPDFFFKLLVTAQLCKKLQFEKNSHAPTHSTIPRSTEVNDSSIRTMIHYVSLCLWISQIKKYYDTVKFFVSLNIFPRKQPSKIDIRNNEASKLIITNMEES